MDDATIERLADLLVGFGANVQPGQVVAVGCSPGKEYLVRAIAASAYKRGAKFVDVSWFDPWVKRARLEHAPDDTLDHVPGWYGERVLALGRERAAQIALTGPVAPGLYEDLDPVRAGRDRLPALKESGVVVTERTTNWSVGPCPTPAWAELVHPDLEPEAALDRLWEQIIHVLRLDEDDPVAAWLQRRDALLSAATRLTSRGFDALHYTGPGTDLTVGLLPGAEWQAAAFETVDGLAHMPNLPTEEVFTTPDPERTEGRVRSSKPLVLQDGTVVGGLEVRFEGGRVVGLEADAGGDTLRTIIGRDAGAARLGEVALVDGAGRIGALDTVFYDTLLDENAASHLALGQGFPHLLSDPARANQSEIHIDFMIGAPELDVSGSVVGGERVPVLVGGAWQI